MEGILKGLINFTVALSLEEDEYGDEGDGSLIHEGEMERKASGPL